jgi:demethylmenaquinone methyltransferase/2-methoxy-6-polyprenyl-1,4-benzoquinol methylase
MNYSRGLELACGTGILSSMLIDYGLNLTGLDLTLEYLHVAKRRYKIGLVQGTAEILPYRSRSFDVVVSSYLAKYTDIENVTEECARVLKPGGMLIFHDFTYPRNVVLCNLWNLYFSVLKMAGKLFTSWQTVFTQLDDIIRNSSWTDVTVTALNDKGFEEISCKFYTMGTAAIVTAKKPVTP